MKRRPGLLAVPGTSIRRFADSAGITILQTHEVIARCLPGRSVVEMADKPAPQ